MFDLDTPFFRPAWRRVLVLALCFGWGLLEFLTGAMFWGILFCGMGGIAFWQFRSVDWSKYDQPGQD